MEYYYASKDSAMREKPPLPPTQGKPLSSAINKNNIIQTSEVNIDVPKKKTKPIAMIEIPNKINKRSTSSSSLCSASVASASTATRAQTTSTSSPRT